MAEGVHVDQRGAKITEPTEGSFYGLCHKGDLGYAWFPPKYGASRQVRLTTAYGLVANIETSRTTAENN